MTSFLIAKNININSRKSFEARWRGEVLRFARYRVKEWDALTCIDTSQRIKLRATFVRVIAEAQVYLVKEVMLWLQAFAISGATGLIVFALAIVYLIYLAPHQYISGFVFIGSGIGLALFLLVFFTSLKSIWSVRIRPLIYISVAGSGVALACILYSFSQSAIFNAMIDGILVTVTVLGMTTTATILITWPFHERLMIRYARSMLISHLQMALIHLVERNDPLWRRVGAAKSLASAEYWLRRLFRSFPDSSETIVRWKTQRTREIACALQEKQRWLITPKGDTLDRLKEHLAIMIVATLTGAWDDWERMQDETDLPRNRNYREIILNSVRGTLVAVLPLATFLATRTYGLIEIDHVLADYLQAGLLLWALLAVIYALDPGAVKERIASIKEIVSITREKQGGDK